jgi:hypothetical protein
MRVKARVERLERRTFSEPSGPPPIEYFDRLLKGSITEQDRQRWNPWLEEHFGGKQPEPANDSAMGTGIELVPQNVADAAEGTEN